MPELAEVEYFRKQWNSGFNAPVLKVLVHANARIFRDVAANELVRHLPGARLVHSMAHGKQMFFHFRPKMILGVHLGMTGRLSVRKAQAPQEKHDHLILEQRDRSLVLTDCRMFGRLQFAMGTYHPEWQRGLPPAMLSANFDWRYLQSAFQRHPKTSIKVILLKQEIFPGIGNWMADEILWQAGMEPERVGVRITEMETKRLYRTIRRICRIALKTIGQNLDYLPPNWLFFSRWHNGNPCPRCKTILSRSSLHGRTTCWCENCQSVESQNPLLAHKPSKTPRRSQWAKTFAEAAKIFQVDQETILKWIKAEGNPGLSTKGWMYLAKWQPWVRFTGRSWFRRTHEIGRQNMLI